MLRRVKEFFVYSVIALAALIEYFRAVVFFAFGGSFGECPSFKNDRHARLHTFSLGSVANLWDDTDYKGNTCRSTLQRELAGLSLPYTMLPLTFWLRHKVLYYVFLFVIYPLICLFLAVTAKRIRKFHKIPSKFRELLIHPHHWLLFWLQGFAFVNHSLSSTSAADTYALENQQTLFAEANTKNLNTTRATETDSVIVKNSNAEGEMGICFYENGKEWIIQEVPEPHESLQNIIPRNHTVTFHVTTASPLKRDEEHYDPTEVISCVMQVEGSGSNNKDSSTYFSIDTSNCSIENGEKRSHWYNTGILSLFKFKQWKQQKHVRQMEGKQISGTTIADIENVLELATKAHATLVPKLALASWTMQLGAKGAFIERVYFLNSNWSHFVNNKLYFKALCDRLLFYEVKDIVKEMDIQ